MSGGGLLKVSSTYHLPLAAHFVRRGTVHRLLVHQLVLRDRAHLAVVVGRLVRQRRLVHLLLVQLVRDAADRLHPVLPVVLVLHVEHALDHGRPLEPADDEGERAGPIDRHDLAVAHGELVRRFGRHLRIRPYLVALERAVTLQDEVARAPRLDVFAPLVQPALLHDGGAAATATAGRRAGDHRTVRRRYRHRGRHGHWRGQRHAGDERRGGRLYGCGGGRGDGNGGRILNRFGSHAGGGAAG